MVRRTTWVLLVVFVALAAFAWYIQRDQSSKAAITITSTPVATAVNLFDMSDSQVVEINISRNSGESIDFIRGVGSSNWVIKDLPAEQADTYKIASVSSQLLTLKASDILTQLPPLDSIGLDSPAYTITLVTADGKQVVTYVGSLSAIGTGYYIRIDSNPVVIVDKVLIDEVLQLLKEPPLLSTPTSEMIATETGTPIAPTAQPTSTQ